MMFVECVSPHCPQGKGGDDDDYEPGGKKAARKPKASPKKRKTDDDDDSDEEWGKRKKVAVVCISALGDINREYSITTVRAGSPLHCASLCWRLQAFSRH